MRLTSSQTWAVVGLASLVWLGLGVSGVATGSGLAVFGALRDAIPALLFGFFVFERWLWRWSFLHTVRLLRTPVVIGTWKGDLEWFWDDADPDRPTIKTVYLTIWQTATTVWVRLLTNESTSVQLAGTVTESESGYPAISYNYRNKPDLKFRKDNVSPIHYGGALIEILGDPATGLKGEYWSDRKTRGEFKLNEHSPDIAQTYEAAQRLNFGSPRPVGVTDGLRRLLRPA